VLKNGPEDADVYLFWSSVQLDAKQVKEAEESARKAVARAQDVGPLVTLASVRIERKSTKIGSRFEKGAEIDPDNATVLNNWATFLRTATSDCRSGSVDSPGGEYRAYKRFVSGFARMAAVQTNKLAEAQKYLEQAVIYQQRSATIHDHLVICTKTRRDG
jgi:Tfp pilus assembly protein PilF